MSEPLLIIAMPGRMGDIVACEPLFRRLHELHPERKIHFYTQKEYLPLLRCVPYIEKIVTASDYAEYESMKQNFPEDAICIELNYDRSRTASVATHKSKEFLPLLQTFAQSANVDVPDESPRFYVDETVPCPELPERYLVFHCRSGEKGLQWHSRYWNVLACKALEAGVHVVEIGESRVIYQKSSHYINMTGKIDLQVAAKVIRGCAGFVSVESGFGHLANALGCFGFIITGKREEYPEYVTFSGDYGHYGSRSNLLRFYDIPASQLPYSVVAGAFKRLLEGNPFSFEECRAYCFETQIKQMRQNWAFRMQGMLGRWFRKLKHIRHHHHHHHHHHL